MLNRPSGEHAIVEVLILRQSNQSNSNRSSNDIGDDGFEPLLYGQLLQHYLRQE
jgi:hypothetical protein